VIRKKTTDSWAFYLFLPSQCFDRQILIAFPLFPFPLRICTEDTVTTPFPLHCLAPLTHRRANSLFFPSPGSRILGRLSVPSLRRHPLHNSRNFHSLPSLLPFRVLALFLCPSEVDYQANPPPLFSPFVTSYGAFTRVLLKRRVHPPSFLLSHIRRRLESASLPFNLFRFPRKKR